MKDNMPFVVVTH